MLRIALQETRVIVYEELALIMLVAYRHSFWLFWIGLESVLAQWDTQEEGLHLCTCCGIGGPVCLRRGDNG